MLNGTRSYLLGLPLIALLITGSAAIVALPPASQPANPTRTTTAEVSSNYGKLPLSFEANQGQAGSSVRFLSHGAGYSLFLTDNGAAMALGQSPGRKDRIRMTLSGAVRNRAAADTAGEVPLPGKVNYFLGNNPARWRTNLPTYAKVRYRGVYPGVDLVYYGNQRQLEYDFVVDPGADTARIRLNFAGGDPPRIDAEGDLLLNGVRGQVVLHKPLVYQQVEGRRRIVPGSFRKLAPRSIGFSLGSYDHSRPLVIDPVLVYSTYLGGSGSTAGGDQGNGIAVDSAGEAYIVGTTFSLDFPITVDAHQSLNFAAAGDGSTVFVSKLNAAGTALVYSTYLGGSGAASGGDFGYGIALDSANNAYITGATYSSDFPVTCEAYQAANPSTTTGATTGFVTKLNASGNGLAYSTYLGGAGNNATSTPSAHGDVSQAIAINSSGNAYVTGYTWSANFPTTTGAFQTAFKGSASISNAFVTQLNSTGTALAYSTYLGGSGSNGAGDYGNAIAVDASGDAFVAGSTASGDFPASSAAFQTSLHGTSNAFVTELNPAGAGEVYSTFLGGSGADSAQAIAVDTSGHAYVGGRTSSTDFPTSASAMEGAGVSNDGIFAQWGLNAFAAKLSPNGSSLVYSTFIEGASASIAGLAIDSAGNLYLAGSTTPAGSGSSGYFQPTADALPAPAGGNSAFVVKLDPAGATFSFASLLGGSGNDVANALALDAGGNVYVTGAALSTDFPTSSSALQTANKAKFANGSNAFISKFALAGEASGLVYSISAPSYLIPTSLEGGVQASTPYCASDYSADSEPAYGFFDLVSSLPGPPVQGIFGYSSQLDVTYYAPAGGVDYFSVEDGFPYDLPATGGSATFGYGAYFLGDGVYAPSSTSGSFTITFCPPPTDSSASSSRKSLLRATRKTAPLAALPGALRKQAAKFLPLPDLFPAARPGALPTPANSTPSCTAPLTPLTVVLRPAARTYGAANPAFSYTISGLRNGDTVSVEPFTTATPASSAGAYPIEADVAGPDAANYAITVNGSTLDVSKAPLYIAARNIDMTYGQTPPSPAGMYTITGFVNGDTQASATSGAPALSTTVTSTSPVGFYPITVGVGTLSATNYFFSDFASGEGKLGVYKAPLVIHPASVTILQGATWQNVPYEITGFANGETQTSATTGAPAFTTNAPSTSVPGRYYIIANVGTLAAQNYYFTNPSPATDGILTILK